MKKIISILLCAIVLVGSVAGVSYANEDINKGDRAVRERVYTFGRFINRFVNAFDENEYPIISDIKDVIADNKEIREENKELREQLNALLKQAKQSETELSEGTKVALENAKESVTDAKEELKAKKEELQQSFDFEDKKAKIQEAKADGTLFNDIANRILNALTNINERLNNRNELLKQLIDFVENDLS